MVCDICCTGPVFGDYNGYNYVWCEATIDGYICGHISHLDCVLRAYMAGKVRGSINLGAHYICRYHDSRMDLAPHDLKLINTCTSFSSMCWHWKYFDYLNLYFEWFTKKEVEKIWCITLSQSRQRYSYLMNCTFFLIIIYVFLLSFTFIRMTNLIII